MDKRERWLFHAMAQEVGRHIDPATAEVTAWYGSLSDPYGTRGEEPSDNGPLHFARSPDSEVWIYFGDLPENTRAVLWETQGKMQDQMPF